MPWSPGRAPIAEQMRQRDVEHEQLFMFETE
jgi:hypothetical protein